MFKRIFPLVVLMIITGTVSAQEGILLRGSLRNAYDKQSVPNAHISIRELGIGTVTNRKGIFAIAKLPAGTYEISVSHVGYLDHTQLITLDSGRVEPTIFITPRIVEIDPVTITATLNYRKLSTLPGRVAVLNEEEIELLPAQNTDELLYGIANVHINRPWGIFSKGASVTMRGLPGSARTLVMVDGVPMNKVSGGTVNWNFIEPEDAEAIEVVKGPNSALYGNNAMSGVVSIKTKKPERSIQGKVRTFGGSMGTFGGAFNLGGADLYKGKGLYWNTKAFLRKGDGYIIEPEETRTPYDSRVSVDEYNIGGLLGYRFDSLSTLDVEYRFYNGTFGTGTKIYLDDGTFDRYRSHLINAGYTAQLGKYRVDARAYVQIENFDREKESISGNSGKYKMSDNNHVKHDNGIRFNISRMFFNNHRFTAGFELKMGDMVAEEIYRTSTDEIDYGGKLNFAGIFLQDEFKLFRNLSVIAGIRFDYATYYDGYQNVKNPTSNTGFLRDSELTFSDESWTQLSPKLALQYEVNQSLGIYVSASTGFQPPKIDDMSKSGKISKGFKLANPQLKPESIDNYELGLTWMPAGKLSVEPSVYYSRGHDFQYFVATGDSVDTGGTDLKPVLQRQNVTEMELIGAEITARWEIITNLVFTANYAMNDSRILEFDDPTNPDKDITGNHLIEVPENEAYASISWRNRVVNCIVDWRYTGKEWYDDENTQYIEPYHVFGLKLSKTLKQGVGFTLSIQNIFDNVTIDRKGKLSPGRFIMGEVFFEI